MLRMSFYSTIWLPAPLYNRQVKQRLIQRLQLVRISPRSTTPPPFDANTAIRLVLTQISNEMKSEMPRMNPLPQVCNSALNAAHVE